MPSFIWGISQISVSEPWWKETHQPVISSYKVCMNGRVSPTIGGKLLRIRSEEFALSGGTQNSGYKQNEWNPTDVLPVASSGWGQGLQKQKTHNKVQQKEQMFTPHKCIFQNITTEKLLKWAYCLEICHHLRIKNKKDPLWKYLISE